MLKRVSVGVLPLLAAILVSPNANASGNTVNEKNQSPTDTNTVVSHVCQQDPSSAFCQYKMTVAPPVHKAVPKEPSPPPPPPPSCGYGATFQYTPPPAIQQDGTVGSQPVDVQMAESCPDGATNVGPPINLLPVTPTSPAAAAKSLADQTYATLRILAPPIVMAPATDATQYVGMPLWAWSPASAWKPKATTATAGGVTLTMTTAPVVSDWSMGDGGSMTCSGPGTPYPATRPAGDLPQSPDCGYTYSTPSSSQPDSRFPVSVTTHWKVTWSTSGGLSGAEPDLTATATTRVKVSEIQALVTNVHP
ncbi:hypothetical protein KGQ19_00575 [Catenulispora sp. NL8]|uniref:ATP/GTP-binding protein n=1 Tax=Catenulispora pinistramenti TaxID=2705254 RepID=A0ABS5KGY7_9ACTN|nr:hypothetical protein [Catenulispora pinistramenti]MBS2545353.1 hypothetical protein [Catenulispora pinistramenti]